MIIQTGMRTDIPAFFHKWLINRIQEGYVLVRNPYNPSQVTRYSLTPDVVDLIAFCTKNPGSVLNDDYAMRTLSNFGQYWYVTITPYGPDIERYVTNYALVMDCFRELSRKVGINSVGWRYDPIIVDDVHTVEWHIQKFAEMAAYLDGYTNNCVISFLDIYEKVERNFPKARLVTREERLVLGKAFAEIAKSHGMVLRPCAEGDDLAQFGADCSGCMTKEIYEKALGARLIIPSQSKNQRNGKCACILGPDIGAYDSCFHLCKYCYANTDVDAVRANVKRHDPNSPFLIGGSMEGDIIRVAEQTSWIDKQVRLDI